MSDEKGSEVSALEAELTSLREQNAALHEQNAALKRAVAHVDSLEPEVVAAIMCAPMALWAIEPSGLLTMSKGRGLLALGMQPDEMVGCNVFDVYAGNEEVLRPIREALEGRPAFNCIEVGGGFWENRYFPQFADGKVVGLFGIAMDVTEQRRAEQARRRADERWRSLVESAPDYIVILDREFRLEFINRAPREPVENDAHGRCILDYIDEEHRTHVRETFEAVLNEAEARRCTLSQTPENGERRWFDMRIGPFWEDGEVTGLVLVSNDVTERRKAEAEKELLRAQVEHSQKLESLGVLAGGIAHDFNNLLVSMLGNAELAELKLTPDHSAARHVHGITDAAWRAADLCQQMLAYAGKARFELRALDLSELVDGMTKLLKVSISKDVVLETHLDRGLWPVHGDVAQLQQVTMNLITNAADALETGRGRVRVSTGQNHFDERALSELSLVETATPGDYVYLEVADTGIGMSAETRARMFDPFFSTKAHGRGLGMASVLGIVRGHGGALGVQSQPSRGTTIRLLLPRWHCANGEVVRVPPDRSPVALTPFGEGRTVLVVDDDPEVRGLARQMLHRLGFETLEATDGDQGVRVYEAQRDAIALVLLDLTMPNMGGIEALRRIRQRSPDMPVLLSSGYDESPESRRSEASGMLRKPYGLNQLAAVVRAALAKN